ncbi:hypothetical protein OE88DRAFT_1807932 [Heliocybe sulcata]|uniref:ABC transmembrane type-1 domain-containing protein n=1 Tax=Heliocybe sulcata TaxID=5364 RepID=A0A5C3N4L2_9AGAM|nr:hypothetical protein OE88DRAFT_1807932 [Heliocybe sulcata]
MGLAVAIFVMQEASSLMSNHYYMRMMTVGVLIRTATIGLIFCKSLRLSGRARSQHSVGQITTMISTDTARLDRVGSMAHLLWTAPIQLAIGIGLLVGTLGYSALVGLRVLILSFPINTVFVGVMFTQHKKGVKITDKWVQLTNEVLQGIRLIKVYAWEAFYGHQLGKLRTAEVQTIRKVAMAQAAMIACMTFIPILAAILSFMTFPSVFRRPGQLSPDANDLGLEKLRRAAVKVVEGSTHSELDAPCKQGLIDLLVDIVAVLEHALEQGHVSTEILTPAFEMLFMLARCTLSISNPDTHTTAYEFLARGRRILSYCSSSLPDLDTATHANYVRCVSGAFYNMAGTLYQANRHASAVRFLQPGCELGTEVLWLRSEVRGIDVEPKQEESWRQLQEHMHKRWELLGVCYSKIGEHKLACDAFIQCIRAFSFSGVAFVQLAKSGPSGSAFEGTKDTKQLGTIIDRVTYAATWELFRGLGDVSLRSALSLHDSDVVGAVLERQIAGLDGSRWKEGVPQVIKALLEDALAVYEPRSRPIRRARVLLRCMEAWYYRNDVAAARHPDEDFGQDAGLVRFASQYLASARMWQMLHVHRLGDPRGITAIPRLLEEACEVLKPLADPIGHASPMKAKSPVVAKKVAASRPTRTVVKRTTGRRVVASRTARQDPATPPKLRKGAQGAPRTAKQELGTPPKPRKALGTTSTNMSQTMPSHPVPSGESVNVFDDFEKFFALLEMAAQLLGLLGQVPARVQILNAMRRLAEHHASDNRDGYVKACVDLAHEYVKLGKIRKAGRIYGQALTVVRSQQASEEAAILFLLRYAESLALADNMLRSSTSYCEAVGLQEALHLEEKRLATYERVKMRVGQLERAAIACSVFSAIQYARDDPSASVKGLLQSLRLWNRALESLARFQPPPPSTKTSTDDNPFDMTDVKEALPSPSDEKPQQPRRQPCRDSLEWCITHGLLATLFALTQAYFSRGSAREAEYFADQVLDLARALNAPVPVGRALAWKGEVQLHLSHLTEGCENLTQASDCLTDVLGPEAADIRCLRGDYHRLSAKPEDAQHLILLLK